MPRIVLILSAAAYRLLRSLLVGLVCHGDKFEEKLSLLRVLELLQLLLLRKLLVLIQHEQTHFTKRNGSFGESNSGKRGGSEAGAGGDYGNITSSISTHTCARKHIRSMCSSQNMSALFELVSVLFGIGYYSSGCVMFATKTKEGRAQICRQHQEQQWNCRRRR